MSSAESTMAGLNSQPLDGGSNGTVDPSNTRISKFIEVDTTSFKNCYEVTKISTPMIVAAISNQLPADNTRRTEKMKGRDEGKFRIYTQNIEPYREHRVLQYNGENLASLTVKQEEITLQGKRIAHREPRSNEPNSSELLITLVRADTPDFEHVSDEELLRHIVNIGIGKVKKAPTPQKYHRNTDEVNGNKYFVLSGLKDGDVDKLPHSFSFFSEKHGPQSMWLQFKGKPRKCKFCSKYHGGPCPLEALAIKLEKEREEAKANFNNNLPLKMYADSTMRLASQDSLACNIDCMSGATIGNLINAIEIDTERKEEDIIIVAGQNEIHRNMTDEEFMFTIQRNNEQLTELAKTTNISILAPPPHEGHPAKTRAKEEVFRKALNSLPDLCSNIKIWNNPLSRYSADDGLHPTKEETAMVIEAIDSYAKEQLKKPLLLPSSTLDSVTTDKFNDKVTRLYKYGCGTCKDKARNKWYHLCDVCKKTIADDSGELQKEAVVFQNRMKELYDFDNPFLVLSVSPNDQPRSILDESIRQRSPLKSNSDDPKPRYSDDSTTQ